MAQGSQVKYGVNVQAKAEGNDTITKVLDKGGSIVNHRDAFSPLFGLDVYFPRAGKDDVKDGIPAWMGTIKVEEPGTKASLALQASDQGLMDRQDAIRLIVADTFNHLLNDIAAVGAIPTATADIMFVDKYEPSEVTFFVKTLKAMCEEYGMSLLGGETSEQPGLFKRKGHYQSGIIGIGEASRDEMIEGPRDIRVGDKLYAVSSSGFHTNGYTMVREILKNRPEFSQAKLSDGQTFLEAALVVHRCYLTSIRKVIEGKVEIHGIAHITGGGLHDNLKRILPDGADEANPKYARLDCDAVIDLSKIVLPELFAALKHGVTPAQITDETMLSTFNLGVGLILVAPASSEEKIKSAFADAKTKVYEIGSIVADGTREVRFTGNLNWPVTKISAADDTAKQLKFE